MPWATPRLAVQHAHPALVRRIQVKEAAAEHEREAARQRAEEAFDHLHGRSMLRFLDRQASTQGQPLTVKVPFRFRDVRTVRTVHE